MTIETIFEDGTSYATTYRFSSKPEAMAHAWHVARLTGKSIKLVHIL